MQGEKWKKQQSNKGYYISLVDMSIHRENLLVFHFSYFKFVHKIPYTKLVSLVFKVS